MKIIFITYDLPYPLSSGGKIRAYQMLKALSSCHEITLFSYVRSDPDPTYLEELNKYCREIKLFKRRGVWSIGHFLRAGFSTLPGAIAHYENPDLCDALTALLKTGNYAAVHFESFYTSLYLSEVKKTGVKTIMGSENIEYLVYRKFVDSLPLLSFPLKIFLYFDLWKMRRFEERVWRLTDVNLAVSEEESRIISKSTGKKCHVVPNGVDVSQFFKTVRKNDGPPTILFIGNLKYLQNDRGIKKFLSEILPLIKKSVPNLVVKIVSSHKPEWIKSCLSEVELIVDSRTPFSNFAGLADVMINPVEVKGGTRIKLLEGLASGLPIVTFSSSLSGFDKLSPGRDLLVAETPKDFAAAVTLLLGDDKARDKIGGSGRQIVAEYYSWEKSMSGLLGIYRKLLNDETITV